MLPYFYTNKPVIQEALGPTGLELAVFLVVWALVEAANGFQSWQLRQVSWHECVSKRIF